MPPATTRHPLVLVAAFALALPVKAQVTDAGPDTSLCVNFYTMQGSALPVGANGQWVLYMGCGTFIDPTSPTTLMTGLCIGSNVAGWVVDDNGTITTDQVEITVYDPNMPAGNAGVDQTIVGPQNWAYLSGWPAPIYPATCQWNWVQGSGVVMDPNDPNSMVTGLMMGDNILTWNCENGPCWSAPTVDTVVIQMMMVTNLSNAAGHGSRTIVYDPIDQLIRVREAAVLDALDVMGMDGRVLFHAGDGYRSISTAGLPAGMYLAKTVINGRREVLRFVVGG